MIKNLCNKILYFLDTVLYALVMLGILIAFGIFFLGMMFMMGISEAYHYIKRLIFTPKDNDLNLR